MGGSKPTAPTYYKNKPTAPIIYQTIQSQGGWDAADDFLKRLRGDRDAIVKDQAAVLGASNAAAYEREQKKYQSAATTPDNPMWVPKTTLAWKDLKYTDLNIIFKKTNFIFKKHETVISFIYFIGYNPYETITHKIQLK